MAPPIRMMFYAQAAMLSTTWGRVRRRPMRLQWPFMFEVYVRSLKRYNTHLNDLDIAGLRRGQERLAQPLNLPIDVEEDQVQRGPTEDRRDYGIAWFRPRNVETQRRVLLYLHGGSYLFGSSHTHNRLIGHLALATPADVLAVNYSLAPEHHLNAAVDDVLDAYSNLLGDSYPSQIAVAGDSAGAALAMTVLLRARKNHLEMPSCLGLISPWADMRCDSVSFVENERWDWGTAAMLEKQAAWASQGEPRDRPLFSPINADLRGLPPTLVHFGSCELLRDDCASLAERLADAGVAVTAKTWPDMVHNFHVFMDVLPLAHEAIGELAGFFREHLETRG